MIIPQQVEDYLQVPTPKVYGLTPSNFWHFKTVENWNFELFSYAKSTNGSPLKYMGKFIVIRKS